MRAKVPRDNPLSLTKSQLLCFDLLETCRFHSRCNLRVLRVSVVRYSLRCCFDLLRRLQELLRRSRSLSVYHRATKSTKVTQRKAIKFGKILARRFQPVLWCRPPNTSIQQSNSNSFGGDYLW